jgi:hypothetical protein
MRFLISVVLVFCSALIFALAAENSNSGLRSGSIEVNTETPGFKIELDGPVRVSGITPFVSTGLPAGKYTIRTIQGGYVSSRKKILLERNGLESVMVEPRPKNRFSAALRSLIIPGWGQKYSERDQWGNVVFWVDFAVAAGYGFTAWNYYSLNEKLESATDDPEKAWEDADNAYDLYYTVGWVLATCWGLNVLDALVGFPSFKVEVVPGNTAIHGDGGPTGEKLSLSYEVNFR